MIVCITWLGVVAQSIATLPWLNGLVMYHRCKPSDLVFVSGSFDRIANLMEVNVYNVSDYGYCEVDRFGWGMFLGLGLTQDTCMDSWLCL